MYDNIFRRVEEKYLLSGEQYAMLFDRIADYIEKDKFFESNICNIYFDTPNNDLIIQSMEKPVFKHKVRLRSYFVPTLDDDVFLEIKFKNNGVVGKRRIRLKLREFNEYLEKGVFDNTNQIMKEIDYLFKLYKLKPAWYISYDRKSYRGINNKHLRITIDTNLRSRKDNLNLEFGNSGMPYFEEEKYIMEIKTLGAMPLWLVRILSDLKVFPVSFSKYGSIYIKDMEE